MAIDFPTTPANGSEWYDAGSQITYVYAASTNSWAPKTIFPAATAAEVRAAASSVKFITPEKLPNSGLVLAAACIFNGTLVGTNAPLKSLNVSTVQRNQAGVYTINFSTPMPHVNYLVSGMFFPPDGVVAGNGDDNIFCSQYNVANVRSVNAVKIACRDAGGGYEDCTRCNVLVFTPNW
jgi:hypothetical protein